MIYRFLLVSLFVSIFVKSQYSVGLQASYTTAFSYNFDNFQIDNQANVYYLEASTYPRKLKKITPNGGYDTNFGVNGVLTSSLSAAPTNYNPDYLVTDTNVFFSNNSFVEKFDSSGNLDTSFGNNGTLTLQTGQLVGYSGNSVFFNNLNVIKKFDKITGIVDPTFQIPTDNDSKFIITNQNIIYITKGSTVKKYDISTGILDPNFGNQGVYTDSRNGKFIVDNVTSNLYFYYVAPGATRKFDRFFSNGQLDNTFSISQPDLIFFINSSAYDFDCVATDSVGRVLLFGGHIVNKQGVIIRLLSNGAMDNTFNNGTYYYRKNSEPYTTQVKIVDDNTYVCTYRYRLSLSGSNYGNNKYVRTSLLGVNEVNNSAISIYPNPVEQYLNIELKNNEKILNLEVVSMDGKLQVIDVKNIQNNKVNLDFLQTGNYILNIKTNKSNYTQKILKK